MPKLKVSKSAKKRFKITGSGKIMREHGCASHLLEKKTTARKKRLAGSSVLSKGFKNSVRKMLGV